MVFPLVPLALGAMTAGSIGNLASSLYQQNNYRNYTNALNQQYSQWVKDFERNTGRKIRYDHLPSNASGMLFQNRMVGIPNSYAQTWGTAFNGLRSAGVAALGYHTAYRNYRKSAYAYNQFYRRRWL